MIPLAYSYCPSNDFSFLIFFLSLTTRIGGTKVDGEDDNSGILVNAISNLVIWFMRRKGPEITGLIFGNDSSCEPELLLNASAISAFRLFTVRRLRSGLVVDLLHSLRFVEYLF